MEKLKKAESVNVFFGPTSDVFSHYTEYKSAHTTYNQFRCFEDGKFTGQSLFDRHKLTILQPVQVGLCFF